jgi:hypothetical protein
MSPSRAVLDAFGASAAPELLAGGRGSTWRAGGIVLKPAQLAVESRWRASVLDALTDTDRLRIVRPVRAATGDWVHEGWEAWHHVPGHTDLSRWNDAVEAGAAFHEALAAVPRPDFLAGRDDWWARADRAAWGPEAIGEFPVLRALTEARTVVESRPPARSR